MVSAYSGIWLPANLSYAIAIHFSFESPSHHTEFFQKSDEWSSNNDTMLHSITVNGTVTKGYDLHARPSITVYFRVAVIKWYNNLLWTSKSSPFEKSLLIIRNFIKQSLLALAVAWPTFIHNRKATSTIKSCLFFSRSYYLFLYRLERYSFWGLD